MNIQPTWLHCRLDFAADSGDIHVCFCSFRCSGTGKRYSNLKVKCRLSLLNAWFRTLKSQDTYLSADWMPTHKPTELSRIKLKSRTEQSVPMVSEHSAHLTSLMFDFCNTLWRYTCLLLLISMICHRQVLFESKGDKLSSSAECRILNLEVSRHLFASRLNALSQTHWATEDRAKNSNSTARP